MPFAYTNTNILLAEETKVTLYQGFNKYTPVIEKELDEPVAETHVSYPLGNTSPSFFLLTVSGKLHAFGGNTYGQLGLGSRSSLINEPQLINDESIGKIIKVKCGLNHTALLNERGEVYVAGQNAARQVGREGNDALTFEKVDLTAFGPVKHLECGHLFTIAVTQKGQLITWGYNPHGASKGEKKGYITHPLPINLPANAGPIINIFAQGTTFYVITPNQVYASGENCYNDVFGFTICKDVEFHPIPQLMNKKIIGMMGGDKMRIAVNDREKLFTWDNVYLHAPGNTTAPTPFPIKSRSMKYANNVLFMLTSDDQLNLYHADTIENMKPFSVNLPEQLESSIKQILLDEYVKSRKQLLCTNLYSTQQTQKFIDLLFTHTEEQNTPPTEDRVNSPT
ncbi:RCC1 domain-containing protein [Legionella fallonii]|uniref:Putative regulator of chromosome condensation, RCC1 n=1 Tax=Legionella fallonii LLAP-10 TaxID=1212491 RepID=A0A098G242_9GAMM|nr:hypothetical protein [Legionella fallonii]CEG56051.1 putative regulator of chromosome condensation, RCC1 [Legionella fallonii LLAP-10]